MSSHLRSFQLLRALGFAMGLMLAVPFAMANPITFLYETKAAGELEPCG